MSGPLFGINGGELAVLLVLVAVVIGPERVPAYAHRLGTWARSLKALVREAKDRLNEDLDGDAVDWAAFDPRNYDPRRIVRDALHEPPPGAPYPDANGRRDASGIP